MASKPSLAQAGPRLLILGGGPVVTEFYLPALSRLGWTSGITVTDRSPDVLAKTARLAPWAATRALGFQEALADRALTGTHDAVVVAVPNSLHVAAVEAALQAGLPVLCEKPLALQAAECQRLGELAASLKLPLAVGMVRRLGPAIQAARLALQNGLLGELKSVEVAHGGPYAWTSDSGAFFRRENGGILADLGVHYLDWLADALGPLEPVAYEDDARGGVEASCVYQLKTPTGVPVTLRLSHLNSLADTVTFHGARATLTLDRTDFGKCAVSGLVPGLSNELTPEQPFVNHAWPRDFVSCFAQQLHDFADAVRGGPVRVSAADALATTALIEHAYRVRTERGAEPAADRPKLSAGRAVVTGGTGFIGGTLVERLAELGFKDLVVPVRNYRTCADAARFPVALPRVDLTQREQVRAAVQGSRWVFHLAYGQTDSDAQRITVDATRLLIEEAVAAKVEAVVVLSTMGVLGHPDTDAPVDESWPYAPAYGSYGLTKAEMERWCLNPATPLGTTRLVVLNPSCVYGPRGKTYTRMPAEFAKEGRFAWVAGGRGIANYTYVENLVDAMLLVAGTPAAHQQRYLVNDGSCPWRELLTPLLGDWAEQVPDMSPGGMRNGESPPVEPSTLRQLAGHMIGDIKFLELINRHPVLGPVKRQAVNRFRNRMEGLRPGPAVLSAAPPVVPRPAPPDWLAELFGPTRTRFSSAKLQHLGWRPRVALAEGQRQSVEWLKIAGVLK